MTSCGDEQYESSNAISVHCLFAFQLSHVLFNDAWLGCVGTRRIVWQHTIPWPSSPQTHSTSHQALATLLFRMHPPFPQTCVRASSARGWSAPCPLSYDRA